MQLITDFFLLFVQNLVFSDLLGLPSVVYNQKNGRGLLRLGLLTTGFCTVSAGILAMLRQILPAAGQKLLYPVCIALICGILDLILVLAAYCSKKLNQMLMMQLHSAAFSSAVIGAAMMSADYTHHVSVAFRYGFEAGLGFLAACLMLKAAAPVLWSAKMPPAFRGWRGMFLYAGLLSMSAACMFPS